ncbi:HutD family protein [uncultured Microbacterium sp.]|uniref:HutD family protein n=1 Tax=uncultured Microbacterium sp. TaxID=191216 RepID=UPI0035CC5625
MTVGTPASPRRFTSLAAVRWVNGGGVTTTLAAGSASDFARGDVFALDGARSFAADWRLSIARIDGPSAFSVLPGFDRVFVVLEDDPVELLIDGSLVIAEPDVPIAFPGEAIVSSHSSGSSRDLNLFLRRGVVTGALRIGEHVAGSSAPAASAGSAPALVVHLPTGDHWWSAENASPSLHAAVVTIAAV